MHIRLIDEEILALAQCLKSDLSSSAHRAERVFLVEALDGARRAKGYTRHRWAKQAGVTYETVRLLQRGNIIPSADTTNRLLKGLRLPKNLRAQQIAAFCVLGSISRVKTLLEETMDSVLRAARVLLSNDGEIRIPQAGRIARLLLETAEHSAMEEEIRQRYEIPVHEVETKYSFPTPRMGGSYLALWLEVVANEAVIRLTTDEGDEAVRTALRPLFEGVQSVIEQHLGSKIGGETAKQ